MDISPLQRHVTASSLPLDKLAANTQVPEQEKIGEISRQFEAVLLRQILSEAQKTTLDKQSQNSSSEIYHDMVTTQLADGISRSGAFGLASSLKTQLGKQIIQPANTGAPETGAAGHGNTL